MATEVEVAKKPSFVESTREYVTDIRSEMSRVNWPSFPSVGLHSKSCPKWIARQTAKDARKNGGVAPDARKAACNCQKQVESATLVVILSVFVFAAYFKIVDKVVEETVLRGYNSLVK